MFIWSIRATTLKFITAVILSVAILTTMIILIPSADGSGDITASGKVNYDSVSNEEDIVKFIESFGWSVDSTPLEKEEVTIPADFDKVFINYNEIQKRQGLDLSLYKRKTVTRYTFKITNYPDYDGTVYANVIIYRSRVIGGDICSASPDGFVYGFDGTY